MYQAMKIFQKGSDFVEWEPISSNNEISISLNYFNTVSKCINFGL